MKIAAKIISILFHPLLMPVIGLSIIFNTNSYINYTVPFENKVAILFLIGLNTCIIPLFISLLLLIKKVIQSLEMKTQKERIIPYALTIIFYVFTLYILKNAKMPPIIYDFIIGATLSVIFAFIINIKWKISAHMIGIGGLIGGLICISVLQNIYVTPYVIFALITAGLIGSSRLLLKAHSQMQLILGFFVGLFCQVFTLCY